MSLIAFDRFGNLTDPKALLKRYGVSILPAERDGPITPGQPVGRVSVVTEKYGKAYFEIGTPPGYGIRQVIPGEDKNFPTESGSLTMPFKTKDATYYPLQGQHGPYSWSVAGIKSDYFTGAGVAFGAYDDQPESVRPKDPYGYLSPTFAVEIYQPGGEPVPQPTPDPAPDPQPGSGLILTADDEYRLRAASHEIADVLANARRR